MKFDLRQLSFFSLGCFIALVPIFGVNWLVTQQARSMANNHLQSQAVMASEAVEQHFLDLVTELRDLAGVAGNNCGPLDMERMRSVTLSRPAVSIAMVLDGNGDIICVSPEMPMDVLNTFNEAQPIFDGDVALSQVRLNDTRVTGLLLELDTTETAHALFIPRQMLRFFFSSIDQASGAVLSLGDTVLFARNPQTLGNADRAEIEVKSHSIAGGAMQVQVSIDRNLIDAAFDSFRNWATIGAVILGAVVVLLITRLVQYTPAQVNEIERAIELDEFVPYYQPTIDIETGKLVGCEVLVRWIKKDGTMVSPGAFIGLAEQTGLAVPMTRKLMEAVVRDLEGEYASRPGLKVAINLFNQHFNNLDIVHDVERIFGPSSITYSQVVLEITERAPLESLTQAKVIMRKLQRLGCRLALDDAGTGHGGLAYLQELGLNIVKIDKMFIDQLGVSRVGESITHTMTELAAQLDMDVVAEGIERIEQVAHLRRYGIRHAQGFLFAPALPAKQYLALVRKLGIAKSTRSVSDEQKEAERKAATIRAAAQQIAVEDDDADADAA